MSYVLRFPSFLFSTYLFLLTCFWFCSCFPVPAYPFLTLCSCLYMLRLVCLCLSVFCSIFLLVCSFLPAPAYMFLTMCSRFCSWLFVPSCVCSWFLFLLFYSCLPVPAVPSFSIMLLCSQIFFTEMFLIEYSHLVFLSDLLYLWIAYLWNAWTFNSKMEMK